MTVVVTILAVVVVGLCVLVAGLLRSHAVILRRLHELGAGVDGDEPVAPRRPTAGAGGGAATPPDFQVRPGLPEPNGDESFPVAADVSGVDPQLDAVAVSIVGAPHDTVIAFLSSTCATCARFWDTFAAAESVAGLDLPPRTRLVVVTKGPDDESPSAVARLAPRGITTVMSSQGWTDYRVPGSPYFVFVERGTGRVRGEGTGLDWSGVTGMLAQATGDLTYVSGASGARVAKPASDAEREEAIDRQLMAAGIFPGDESLFTPPVEDDPR